MKGCGKPAVNPSYSQQQRESPQIPFPFSRVQAAVGETRLMSKARSLTQAPGRGDALV